MGQKNDVSGLFTNQNISDTIRRLCLVFLNDVAVEILCGGYAGMTQMLGHRNNIGSICQEDRVHRVAECVGIDMGQTAAGGDFRYSRRRFDDVHQIRGCRFPPPEPDVCV